MKTVSHFEHLTINTGHSYISPSWQCDAASIEFASTLLGKGLVWIPCDFEVPLFLMETGNDKGAVTTIHTFVEGQMVPIVEWWTVWKKEESATCWEHVKKAKADFAAEFRNSDDLRLIWESMCRVTEVMCPQIVP